MSVIDDALPVPNGADVGLQTGVRFTTTIGLPEIPPVRCLHVIVCHPAETRAGELKRLARWNR